MDIKKLNLCSCLVDAFSIVMSAYSVCEIIEVRSLTVKSDISDTPGGRFADYRPDPVVWMKSVYIYQGLHVTA